MNCLKCGRETDQTFCESCREIMARYPVKPGTIIQLPKDRTASRTRHNQNWRSGMTLETQVENQKRTIRRLGWTIVILALLLLGVCVTMFWLLRIPNQPPVGQNYVSVTKTTEDPTQPTTETETSSDTSAVFHVEH